MNAVGRICYVCGYPLDEYPYHPEALTSDPSVICPSCGFHYGFDDGGAGEIIPDELAYSGWIFGDDNHKKIMEFWRKRWINNGAIWQSLNPLTPQPVDWNPKKQLENIGIKLD